MNVYTITPLNEVKQLLLDILADYKTVASKRAFLTRERKAHVSLLADFTESLANAKKRGEYLGWLHGERINNSHVVHARNEIALIDRLYVSLVA